MEISTTKQTKTSNNTTVNDRFQMPFLLLQTTISLLIHPSGTLLKASKRFLYTFRFFPEEIKELNICMLTSMNYFESIKKEVNKTGFWEGELSLNNKNNRVIDCIGHITICSQTGNYLVLLFPHNLINQSNRYKELAYKDDLTGLPNYRKFEECISSKINQSHRFQSKFGLIFIDIDNFKQINDHFGHIIGDKILKECASSFEKAVKRKNKVFRKSGDEFIVIVDEIDEIESIMHRIQSELGKGFNIEGIHMDMNISIGFGVYPDHGRYAESLIDFADKAMYRTKRMNKSERKARRIAGQR